MARRSRQTDTSARDYIASHANADRTPKSPLTYRWTWQVRAVISVAIVFHLIAVFIGAWVGSPPTSPLADEVARPFRAYIAVADLNHGYRFFAPNPGPSHIFRYRLTFDDGSTKEVHFPDRARHWPRLLYHRYFMLSENLNAIFPRRFDGDEREPSPADMGPFRALGGSYAAQLLRESRAERIDWELVRHYQASPDEVLEGRSLLDDSSYVPVGSGAVSREELR